MVMAGLVRLGWAQCRCLEERDDGRVPKGDGWGSAAEAATFERDDGVGVAGIGQVVGREQDGATRVCLGSNELKDPLLGRGVEAGCRLVEQQDRCMLSDALCDEGALALPAGEFVDRPATQVREPDTLECFVACPPVGAPEGPEEASGGVAAHSDDVLDGEPELGVDGGCLEHIGNRSPCGDRAGRGSETAADEGQHRRLSRSVGSDHRGDGSGRDRQAQRLESEGVAVVGVDHRESDRRVEV